MGALFWRSKQPKTETCLSKGTGSAFKDGGLQGNGLKPVLATAVVFGRACGAASTTLTNEKTIEKHGTGFENEPKNRPGAIPEPTDSRDEPKAPQKVAERAHRQPRRTKSTYKDDTSTPKETTKPPQGCEKRPQGLQKRTKNYEKT